MQLHTVCVGLKPEDRSRHFAIDPTAQSLDQTARALGALFQAFCTLCLALQECRQQVELPDQCLDRRKKRAIRSQLAGMLPYTLGRERQTHFAYALVDSTDDLGP